MKLLALCTSLLALAPSFSQADERIRPAKVLLQEGYVPVPKLHGAPKSEVIPWPKHSLNWPVVFQDSAHSLGNVMAEFQPFDDPPYFHGGCDLRVKPGADIHAPVSGKIAAGHYSYVTNADGSLTKYMRAWPEDGDPVYFEIALISEDGTRFEFHHVDEAKIPGAIQDLLNHGGGVVPAGTLLGQVLKWPDGDYDHTHYNVILADGTRVNPEFLSPLLPDTTPPELRAVFAIYGDGSNEQISSQTTFSQRPTELVVRVADFQDHNVYSHPPAFIRLAFENGAATEWDFRRTLQSANGGFPNLPTFFLARLTTAGGETLETSGGFGTGESLLRLAIPNAAHGAFTIEASDIAGNTAKFSGVLN